MKDINNNGTEVLSRNDIIIKTSIIGIAANILLSVFKVGVGVLSHSIAVVLDAVNNLSDAASSVITIVGTKLAQKKPDRNHPFGHGRLEYLSALTIAFIILYAGSMSLTESVKKIISPEKPDYSPVSLIIIAVAVAVKVVLGRYVKHMGIKANSDSLKNSGDDASLDALISFATLVAAGIYIFSGVSLEAWLAGLISLLIIKTGFDMIKETVSKILGERIDIELTKAIKDTVCSFPGVFGAYDLILHNYGPDSYMGSIHIEVQDTQTADELDELLRELSVEVHKKHNVILTAVGVYSINTKDKEVAEIREKIKEEALSVRFVKQIHGFFLNKEKKSIRFDAVIDFDAPDREEVQAEISKKISAMYPEYTLKITLDSDFSD